MYDVYRAPESGGEPEDSGELSLLATPNRCPAVTGWAWIPQAFSIFRERWGMWLLICLVASLCSLPFSFNFSFSARFFPLWLTSFLSFLLSIFLMCGIVYGAASQVENGELAINSLFAGFRMKFKNVLILSLLQLLILLVLCFVALIPATLLIGLSWQTMQPTDILQNLGSIIAAYLLFFLIVGFGMVLTTWFAPTLVMLHDIPPTRAIAMSVRGGLANLLPLLVYVLTMIGFIFAFGLLFNFLPISLPKDPNDILSNLLFTAFSTLIFTVWSGLIGYVSYLSIWTNAELES